VAKESIFSSVDALFVAVDAGTTLLLPPYIIMGRLNSKRVSLYYQFAHVLMSKNKNNIISHPGSHTIHFHSSGKGEHFQLCRCFVCGCGCRYNSPSASLYHPGPFEQQKSEFVLSICTCFDVKK
jgi:hypothetical protein